MTIDLETRFAVEDFVTLECQLLDDWRLQEWFELMSPDCSYEVPATDARDGLPATTLCLIADNHARLKQRVAQLLGPSTWSENPRSRTRRLVANLAVVERESHLDLQANFIIHRFAGARSDVFVGHYENELVRAGASFKVRRRRAVLDHTTLFHQGKISIIL